MLYSSVPQAGVCGTCYSPVFVRPHVLNDVNQIFLRDNKKAGHIPTGIQTCQSSPLIGFDCVI